MDINLAIKNRIGTVKKLLENKEEVDEEFKSLLLLVSKIDVSLLDSDLIKETNKLKDIIEINTIKNRLDDVSKKERKLIKVDDFREICSLMKDQQYNEAIKKFNKK